MKININNLFYSSEILRNQYSECVMYHSELFIVKNYKSEAIVLSENYALCSGYSNPVDFLGVDDSGLKIPAAVYAHEFIQEDRYVLETSKATTHLFVVSLSGFETNTYIYHKQIYNSNLVCNVWSCKDTIALKLIHMQLKRMHKDQRKRFMALFSLIQSYPGLSKRESQVLYFLMQGNSSTKVGMNLGLSKRTVQHYIISIKQKFLCETTQQVIEHSLFHGFYKKIPYNLVVSTNMHQIIAGSNFQGIYTN